MKFLYKRCCNAAVTLYTGRLQYSQDALPMSSLRWPDLASRRYVQQVYDRFDELQAGDPSLTWDSEIVREEMQSIFNTMNHVEKVAYMLTFGFPAVPYEKDGVSVTSDPPDSGDPIQMREMGFATRSFPFPVADRRSVSFAGPEMTREQFFFRHVIRLFIETDILDHCCHEVDVNEKILPKVENDTDVMNAMDEEVHRHIRPIILSILEDDRRKTLLTRNAIDFLLNKTTMGVIKGFQKPKASFEARYNSRGEAALSGIGISTIPEISIGYNAQFWNRGVAKNYGLAKVTVIGKTVLPGTQIRKTFDSMIEFFLSGDKEFYEAVAQSTVPITVKDMNKPRVPVKKPGKRVKAQVNLFLMISNLTTQAFHAGANRFYLSDYNDFLLVQLSLMIDSARSFRNTPNFPKLTPCEHIWFNRSDEFVRLCLLAFSSPV